MGRGQCGEYDSGRGGPSEPNFGHKGKGTSKGGGAGKGGKTGTVGTKAARITAQVCGVSKPLYSVAQAVKAGFDVTFSQKGSGMKHRESGLVYPFVLRNGMYELTMDVTSGFARPGMSA